MGLYPCLHRELYQGRGQVENCRSQQRAHNKKEVKKCKQRSCNQFPLLLCWFLYSGNERVAEKDLLGLLWNHLVIHVQLADFLPIDSNQGKNAAAASAPATL